MPSWSHGVGDGHGRVEARVEQVAQVVDYAGHLHAAGHLRGVAVEGRLRRRGRDDLAAAPQRVATLVGLLLDERVVYLHVGDVEVEHAGAPERHFVKPYGVAVVVVRGHGRAEAHLLHAVGVAQPHRYGVRLVDDALKHLFAVVVKAYQEEAQQVDAEALRGIFHDEAHSLRFSPGGRAVEDEAVRALHAHDAEVASHGEAGRIGGIVGKGVFRLVGGHAVQHVFGVLQVGDGEQRAADILYFVRELVVGIFGQAGVHQGRAAGRRAGLGAQLVAHGDHHVLGAAVGRRGREDVDAVYFVQVGHVSAGGHLHGGARGRALQAPRHAQLGVGFKLEGVLCVAHVGVERRVDGAVVVDVGLFAHEDVVDADGAHAHRQHGVEAQLGTREGHARRGRGHAVAAARHREAHGAGRERGALHLVVVAVKKHDVYPRAHVEGQHVAHVVDEAW